MKNIITKDVFKKMFREWVAVIYLFVGIVFLLLMQPEIASAQNKTSNIMSNKELISKGFEQWANGTGSFFNLLADDIQWTITGSTPLSKTYIGKKQFIDEVIDPLNLRLSKKIIPKVIGLYGEGDMVIALWEGMATAKDGKPYNATYSWNMEIKEGKIIRVIAFLDGIEFRDIMTRIQVTQN